ncbi:MAG: iron complex transport system permease protein [Gammaproteobacteria bacterium]|jgi:iron complex transport system permease protein
MFLSKHTYLFSVLIVSTISIFIISLLIGSVDISVKQLLHALWLEDDSLASSVVLELRLPRTVVGFMVGAMLALAGALMQVLLRNPLAEPYVLGVSGGASAAVLIAMLSGLSGFWISGSAFLGAMISMLLVFGLAHGKGDWSSARLLLTGIVIASGWGALISLILSITQGAQLRGMLFWLMGDLSYAQYSHWASLVLIACLIVSLLISRNLNILARGELQAATLGVSPRKIRYLVYFLSSLLAATAVTLAGNVGFVGLIVPHAIRLMVGSDHRILLPAAFLLGGCLVMLADCLARTVIAPQQLPVGVLTAIIGIPVFLVLLRRQS